MRDHSVSANVSIVVLCRRLLLLLNMVYNIFCLCPRPTLNPQDEAHVVIKPHYRAAWCAQRRKRKHLIQSLLVLYMYFQEMSAIQCVKDNKVLKDVISRIQVQTVSYAHVHMMLPDKSIWPIAYLLWAEIAIELMNELRQASWRQQRNCLAVLVLL